MSQENTRFEPALTMAHLGPDCEAHQAMDTEQESEVSARWFDEAVQVRLLWALCQVERAIHQDFNPDSDVPPDGWFEVWFEMWSAARRLGYEAYPESEVPALIAVVPELRRLFLAGFADAAEMVEMMYCSYCQDDTGNPCPEHG